MDAPETRYAKSGGVSIADQDWGWSPEQVDDLLEDVRTNWGKTALLELFAPTAKIEAAGYMAEHLGRSAR